MTFLHFFYIANPRVRGMVIIAALCGALIGLVWLWAWPDIRRRRTEDSTGHGDPDPDERGRPRIAIADVDFDVPPPYGADIDWSGNRGWQTTGDVVSVDDDVVAIVHGTGRYSVAHQGATVGWSPTAETALRRHSGEFTDLADLPSRGEYPETRVPRTFDLEADVHRAMGERFDDALAGSRARLDWLAAAEAAPIGQSRAAYRHAAGADDTQAIAFARIQELIDTEAADA